MHAASTKHARRRTCPTGAAPHASRPACIHSRWAHKLANTQDWRPLICRHLEEALARLASGAWRGVTKLRTCTSAFDATDAQMVGSGYLIRELELGLLPEAALEHMLRACPALEAPPAAAASVAPAGSAQQLAPLGGIAARAEPDDLHTRRRRHAARRGTRRR